MRLFIRANKRYQKKCNDVSGADAKDGAKNSKTGALLYSAVIIMIIRFSDGRKTAREVAKGMTYEMPLEDLRKCYSFEDEEKDDDIESD